MIEKRVAIVTGSRRGIGLGIAKALGKDDCFVVVSSTTPEEQAQIVLEELKGEGIEAVYFKCDISKSMDRSNIVNFVLANYGRLDILVNNAGVAPTLRLDILETTEESYDRVMNMNLKGTFFMCQAAANAMIQLQNKNLQGFSPRIVNISSMSAYTSSTLRGEYCISKAGISMTTQLIADGITPIKRFGYPEDVANCVKAACSGLLDFGTGQILNADGGFHIRRL